MACVLATGLFVWRGPIALLQRDDRLTDLFDPYLGARAWTQGLNPYEPEVIGTLRVEAGFDVGVDPSEPFDGRTAYPVSTFVLLAPVSELPWAVARAVAAGAAIVLTLAAIMLIATLPGSGDSRARWLFVVMALTLAPIHTGLNTSNLAGPAVALTVMGVALVLRGQAGVGGVTLGLAFCLKPAIGIVGPGYFLMRGRWRVTAAAAGVVAAATLAGALRLQVSGVPWLDGYLYNNSLLLGDSGGALVEGSRRGRQFLHLQVVGHVLFHNARLASALALAVAGGLLAWWLWLVPARGFLEKGRTSGAGEAAQRAAAWIRDRGARDQDHRLLLEVGALAVISLLPVYHRVYDAGLLLLPLGWALLARRPVTARHRRLALWLLVPFLLPGVSILERLEDTGFVFAGVTESWWWQALVIPHQVWTLLALAIVLLFGLRAVNAMPNAYRNLD